MASKNSRVLTVLVGEPWSEDDLELRTRSQEVLVGEPWTADDAEVEITHRIKLLRTRMAIGGGCFFAALITSVDAYAMAIGDLGLVREVFTLAKVGGFAVLGWAVGVQILKIVSSIKFDDPDDEKKKGKR